MARIIFSKVTFILLFLGLSTINAQCVKQVNMVSRSDGFPDIILYVNGVDDKTYAFKIEYVQCDSSDSLVFYGSGLCMLTTTEHQLVMNDINLTRLRLPILPFHGYDIYLTAIAISSDGGDTTIRYHFHYYIDSMEEWICKELLIDTVSVDTLDSLPSFPSVH